VRGGEEDIELNELDEEILDLEVIGISDPEPEPTWTSDQLQSNALKHLIVNYKSNKTKLKKLGWKYVGSVTKLDGRVEVLDMSSTTRRL
jgi:hypothetical protein